MVWSHNDNWMVTGDHAGYVKYWQSNMNNVRMFQAHKDPVRGIRYVFISQNAKRLIQTLISNWFTVLVHPIINSRHAVTMERCVFGTSCDAKKSAFFEGMVQM